MKTFIITSVLFLLALSSFGQCNCKTLNKEDGSKATICAPLPVAGDNNLEIGLGVMEQKNLTYISLTIRFTSSAQAIKSDLNIALYNNDLVTLKYVNGQLGYIGGSQIAQALFLATKAQVAKIKNSKILTIAFKFNDGLIRTYKISLNSDVLMEQFKCIH